MKRIGGLFKTICSIERLKEADKYARRGKHNYGILKHDRNKEKDIENLFFKILSGEYKTSKYDVFTIYEPKERKIFRLPYYPDRIMHWAIMLTMKPIWTKLFIKNSYACIKNRGIHRLVNDLKKVLIEDKEGTKYCLKLDIKKFYPSINHDILKEIIRKKIKDKDLLKVLDEIIDSSEGVPIGNYLSQFFANLYLTYFDHWIKEEVKVRYYFRYADDIVILSSSKEYLRKILILIKMYLHHVLKLEIKSNYQVFPIETRGIDFVGYIFFHNYTKLRKSIKRKIISRINKYNTGHISFSELKRSLTAYFGWLKYCNSKNLLNKIEISSGLHFSNWRGKKSNISFFKKRNVKIMEVIPYSKYFKIHLICNNRSYTVNSRSKKLFSLFNNYKFPLNFTFYDRT